MAVLRSTGGVPCCWRYSRSACQSSTPSPSAVTAPTRPKRRARTSGLSAITRMSLKNESTAAGRSPPAASRVPATTHVLDSSRLVGLPTPKDLPGGGGDLPSERARFLGVDVPGPRPEKPAEAIRLVARHNVDMQVRHTLADAVVDSNECSIAPQPCFDCPGYRLNVFEEGAGICKIDQRWNVARRNNQRVPLEDRTMVKERHGNAVVEDQIGLHGARNHVAEDAVLAGHSAMLIDNLRKVLEEVDGRSRYLGRTTIKERMGQMNGIDRAFHPTDSSRQVPDLPVVPRRRLPREPVPPEVGTSTTWHQVVLPGARHPCNP